MLTSLLKREPMKSSRRQQPLFDQADRDHRQKGGDHLSLAVPALACMMSW